MPSRAAVDVDADLDAAELASRLYSAVSVLSRRARLRAAADAGLSLPERSVLTRLHRGGPSTAAELARAEQIRPQGMGLMLGRLRERRLIERHRDPDDGRTRRVLITAAGRETLAAKRDTQTERLADLLATEFDDDERARFAAVVPLFERLVERI